MKNLPAWDEARGYTRLLAVTMSDSERTQLPAKRQKISTTEFKTTVNAVPARLATSAKSSTFDSGVTPEIIMIKDEHEQDADDTPVTDQP